MTLPRAAVEEDAETQRRRVRRREEERRRGKGRRGKGRTAGRRRGRDARCDGASAEWTFGRIQHREPES